MSSLFLIDILEIKNGRDHKHLKDGNIPVYGSGGLMRLVDSSIYDDESILLPRKGTLSNIQYTNKPFWTVDTLYYTIINKKKAVPYYLYHYLKRLDLSNLNSGTGVPSMTFGAYYGIKINLPELEVQQKIAKVLSDLDAKIELNKKISSELEAMAKTIYEYWFVQFDFPFDFAQGRPDANGKPYKTNGGKMVWNEELKREIPEGWGVEELERIAKCIMGQSPKGESYNLDKIGIPLLNGPADYENGVLKGRTYTTEPTRLCQKDDLVLCIRATIGNLVYSEQEFCLGRGVAAVRPVEEIFSELIYFLLLQEIERFKIHATGSIIVGITKDDLTQSKCLIPKVEILESFHKLIKPQFNKMRTNLKENQHLASLRDWLLPMLMNGQVTVGDIALRQAQGDELGMVAEPKSDYKSSNDTFNEIFNQLNYDYEIAAVVSLTFQRFKCYYGKKYIHKMFSNIQMLNTLPVFKELTFQENGWGMFSPQIKKAIEDQKFVKFGEIKDNQKVLEVNIKYLKEIGNWIKDEENKAFVSQVNDMLTIYESPTINKKMDNIELFNTILECMKVLKTDNFEAIYHKMKAWPMKEEGYETKADKFTKMQTKGMILFIKEIKK